MAGAGLLHRPIDRLERLPATLGQDRSKPEFARHPGRHLRAGPQAAVRGWLKQTSLELLQQVGPQNGGACPVPASQITQSLRTLGVVARQQPFDPALRIRHRGRDLGDMVPLGQKPDGLKVPRRRHVRAGPVLLLQSRNAQMIRHMRHGSPPRLMALQSILSPNRRESLPTPSAGVRMTDDILLVQINPIERRATPRTAHEIQNRLTEITFNGNLLKELRAADFVTRLIDAGKLSTNEYKRVRMHRISGGEKLDTFTASSRLCADWSFFQELKDLGRATAERWLAENYGSVGVRSTLDLKAAYS